MGLFLIFQWNTKKCTLKRVVFLDLPSASYIRQTYSPHAPELVMLTTISRHWLVSQVGKERQVVSVLGEIYYPP